MTSPAEVPQQPEVATSRPTYTAWCGWSGISTSDREEALALAQQWAANGEKSYVEQIETVTTATVIWTSANEGAERA